MNCEQNAVHQSLVGSRHIIYIIHGLIESCVCIYIRAKTDSLGLKIIEHILSGVMACSVECHMFKKVCKTELLRCLERRTDFLRYIKICTLFGFFIMHDKILQAVRQCSMLYCRVKRQRLHLRLLSKCSESADDHYRHAQHSF